MMAPLLRHPWLRSSARSLHFLHLHEVRHARDHPAHFRTIGQHIRRADLAETERAQCASLLRLDADLRSHECDLDRRHGYATSVTSCLASRWRSRYAASMPFVDTSSADLPRSRATSSGLRRSRRPCIVARATLIALDEPRDLASTSWIPADSRIARAAPPAITPVPGAAGFRRTRAASCSPRITWVIVEPASGTA